MVLNSMINKKLAFMAIPVLAAVLIGGSLSPAFAAQKIIDVHTIDTGVFGAFVCGTSVVGELHINSHFKLWDNGHFKIHSTINGEMFDTATGNFVADVTQVLNDSGGKTGLPLVLQDSFNVECADGTTEKFHFGFTIDENGNTHFHGPPPP